MRPPARFLPIAIGLLGAFAVTPRAAGQISSDTREMPPPPAAPPLMNSAGGWEGPQYRVTFFPPTPPVFGAPVPTSPPSHRFIGGRDVPIPEQLGDWVEEPFYPALGTRLARSPLDKKLAERLASYRTKRDTLLGEIQNQLTISATADPATRERELRELAQAQAPRLTALETEAEAIRTEMVEGGWSSSGADWNQERGWRLGKNVAGSIIPPNFSGNAEFQVVRAAAFFEKGLLPEQRGLLREIAMEQNEKMRRGRLTIGPGAASAAVVIFFSPETSRLTLPKDMSPALREKLGAYNHDKDVLKRELHDAVIEQDKASTSKRSAALRALAEKQWPRFVLLAELAESVRHELASLPPPPAPAMPPLLPKSLPERIASYKSEREKLERERNERRLGVATNSGFNLVSGELREAIADRLLRTIQERNERMRQADQDFLRENLERYAALQVAEESILADLAAAAQSTIDPATGKPMTVPALRRLIEKSDQQFDQLGREEVIYRNYRIAMLEPGLSAGQRRLLFGSALAGLAQPLPFAERMPDKIFRPIM